MKKTEFYSYTQNLDKFLDGHILKKENPSKFLCNGNLVNRVKVMTGGSSGNVKYFYKRKNYPLYFRATRDFCFSRLGYKIGSKVLDLTANIPDGNLFLDFKFNILYLPINKLNLNFVLSHLKIIEDYNPEYLIGYPSTIIKFYDILDILNKKLNFKLVISGSENFNNHKKKCLKKISNCNILEWYGMSEMLSFAYECPSCNKFHFLPYMGNVDSIDHDKKNNLKELVITSYDTAGTIFYKYKTSDIVRICKSNCKNNYANILSFEKVYGRESDYILSNKNDRIPLITLNIHSQSYDGISQFQLIQTMPGTIEVHYIIENNHKLSQINFFKKKLRLLTGKDFKIMFFQKKNLLKNHRGKLIFFINKS